MEHIEVELDNMSFGDRERLLNLLKEQDTRERENKIFYRIFKDGTPLSIESYPKQKKFFDSKARFRAFIAGNRVGKTESLCFELACHAIGWYPWWWQGHTFNHKENIKIIIAGDSNTTVRDILQEKLLGGGVLGGEDTGTGMIPKKYIRQIFRKNGVKEFADKFTVDRLNGGIAEVILKSYEQGRKMFQGVEADIILLDEEPPNLDIYGECMLRLATTNGIMMLSFTPLMGLTPLIQELVSKQKENPRDFDITTAGWDDVPHLDEEMKASLLASVPEWQLESRRNGVPQLGAGAIYRKVYSDIEVAPFEIPSHWKKMYALDVGWKTTAVVFGAIDPDNNKIYIYDELYVHEKQPHEYARMIKERGKWLPGVIDGASNGSSQIDGRKIFEMLKAEGLDLRFADKAIEAGILKTHEHLIFDKLRFFKGLDNLKSEYNNYHRDENGKIVKRDDHLMDALRYLVMGTQHAKVEKSNKDDNNQIHNFGGSGWMM